MELSEVSAPRQDCRRGRLYEVHYRLASDKSTSLHSLMLHGAGAAVGRSKVRTVDGIKQCKAELRQSKQRGGARATVGVGFFFKRNWARIHPSIRKKLVII